MKRHTAAGKRLIGAACQIEVHGPADPAEIDGGGVVFRIDDVLPTQLYPIFWGLSSNMKRITAKYARTMKMAALKTVITNNVTQGINADLDQKLMLCNDR